ncbi:MAG: hypothetical protein EAZ85_13760 [Bacteroidetes bacterium]|nr:MAG: hypothetical protein EAZ85_13760 [Bacteroidota bacterium]TAG86341.1 MAG: hypothetical protein EAZ20_13005 [Bacteroidota bacterium]
MKAFLITILMCANVISLTLAQKKEKEKIVKVSAKIEVLMEGSYSKEALKQKAIETARIKAIGDEFGYSIVQGINTQTKTLAGQTVLTTSSLNEVSNTIVKGEWISDEKGFPITKFIVREKNGDQEIWLECEVKGKARKIIEAKVNFETFAYKCQNEPKKCITTQFKENESMFVYFKAATKGFLSVFMLENGKVFRLLPYREMENEYESLVPVVADKEYMLFSPEHRNYFEGFGMVDEYGLTLSEDKTPLANMLFVVFSEKSFKKPLMEEQEGFKTLSLPKFQEWMNQNKGLDKTFQVQRIPISVNE